MDNSIFMKEINVENIMDIISLENGKFKNLCTGAISEDLAQITREGIPYEITGVNPKAYYTHVDNGILYIIYLKFDRTHERWFERGRFVIWRKKEGNDISCFCHKQYGDSMEGYGKWGNEKDRDEVLRFLGGPMIQVMKDMEVVWGFDRYNCLCALMSVLKSNDESIYFGRMHLYTNIKQYLPIPDSIGYMEKIENCCEGHFFFIDHVGGEDVLRFFIFIGSMETSVEYKRIRIWKNMPFHLLDNPNFCIFAGCSDSCKAGDFRYVMDILDTVKGINDRNAILFIHAVTYSPVFEGMCRCSNNTIVNELMYKMRYNEMTGKMPESLDELESVIYGQCNVEKKTLYGKLGIPCVMFKRLMHIMGKTSPMTQSQNNEHFTFIREIKNTFQGREKLLMTMGKEMAEKIVDVLSACITISGTTVFPCLKNLMDIYGEHRLSEYLEHIETVIDDDCLSYYCGYVRHLHEIGEFAKRFEWDVRDDRLRENARAVYDIGNMLYRNNMDDFQSMSESWKQYEYQDEEFMVVSPQNPIEMIEEGIKLRHCASSFISLVTEGKTTILFIRKTNDSSKPYFTLEIRNGRIRQCHGFANRNVPAGSRLLTFLQEYCRHKGIMFDIGDKRLPVNLY